jgi:hypothetical protein
MLLLSATDPPMRKGVIKKPGPFGLDLDGLYDKLLFQFKCPSI